MTPANELKKVKGRVNNESLPVRIRDYEGRLIQYVNTMLEEGAERPHAEGLKELRDILRRSHNFLKNWRRNSIERLHTLANDASEMCSTLARHAVRSFSETIYRHVRTLIIAMLSFVAEGPHMANELRMQMADEIDEALSSIALYEFLTSSQNRSSAVA